MSFHRYRLPTGQVRPWRLREVIQGKPLRHPSHALFVHFPVAFYFAVLGLDVLSRVGSFPAAPVAATWLLLAAFTASVFAVATGLVDWWTMVPGSRKRRWATKHMLLQLATFAIFAVDFLVRWSERHSSRAATAWMTLEVFGVGVLVVGQWFGGVLVYEMGMRVSTGRGSEGASSD